MAYIPSAITGPSEHINGTLNESSSGSTHKVNIVWLAVESNASFVHGISPLGLSSG